jgi:predicted nuclease of predicted toxin-antitoxin system
VIDILADENIDRPIVQWLRARGHDVLWVCEQSPGADDAFVLDTPHLAGRVLLTFDLDFGELVVRQKHKALGVILLRLRPANIEEMITLLESAWPAVQSNAIGNFVVVTAGRVRVRPL